jgi:biopolymer transport protein TolR
MTITNPLHHDGAAINLPDLRNAVPQPGGRREDAMRVFVTRDGKVFFGQTILELGELPKRVEEALQQGSERKIYLNADTRAKYGDIKPVLDEIRLAGITRIAILTADPHR